VDHRSPFRPCLPVLCVPRVQQALRRLVDRFAGYSLRLNTHLAYESRQRIFHAICACMGIDSYAPITEVELCGVCIVYAHRHRITGLAGFVSAIASHAVRSGFPDLPRGRTFDRVKAGLLNYYGDTNYSQPTRGFTVQDLYDIRQHIDLDNFADARDWCAALFAFYGLLRIKEYTCSGLLRRHVTTHEWGINLAIPFSKTSLIPTAVAIVRRDDELCPLAAHVAYTRHLPARLRRPDVAYFLHSHSLATPLTDTTFIRHVRRWVRDHLRHSPSDYSGHSFRRGGTTALQIAGVPESTIASHGRWKSLTYRAYFDVQFNLQLRLSATAQLSLHDRRRLGQEPSVPS
jgi:hypothetical protein